MASAFKNYEYPETIKSPREFFELLSENNEAEHIYHSLDILLKKYVLNKPIDSFSVKELVTEITLQASGRTLLIKGGNNNTSIPAFLLTKHGSISRVTLHISKEYPYGKKQLLYFFLKHILFGELKEYDKDIFAIDNTEIYGIDEPTCIEDMNENSDITKCANILLSYL